MSIYKRYFIFIIGIIIQAAGIAIVVRSLLGNSPISSVPYVLSLVFPYTMGVMTFLINMVFLVAQILILGSRFQKVQLLQIPMTAIFAAFIDISLYAFSGLLPELYVFKLVLLLFGASCVALGVSLQIIADVVMLAGEAIVNAIAIRWHFDFGKVKTAFDTSLVCMAAIFSLSWLGSIEGVREGTLISALATGMIARFFIHHLGRVDSGGQLVFAPHLSNHTDRIACEAGQTTSEKN